MLSTEYRGLHRTNVVLAFIEPSYKRGNRKKIPIIFTQDIYTIQKTRADISEEFDSE